MGPWLSTVCDLKCVLVLIALLSLQLSVLKCVVVWNVMSNNEYYYKVHLDGAVNIIDIYRLYMIYLNFPMHAACLWYCMHRV